MAASTAAQNPRKQPQQRRSRATVDKILAAAAQVLAEEGDGATTDRIAARAGVSIGSLYQYFPNKGALMLELARRAHGRRGRGPRPRPPARPTQERVAPRGRRCGGGAARGR
ncbi:helix-turn-helix domain-containing protein [uncultured Ornithinimicrobium sp.]|uniref:helix-turn-helix domain-containing protein n=1 Tax=uncultured Ornithinimicrobium sp. TaxID=259307 RepID=UPI00338FDD5A